MKALDRLNQCKRVLITGGMGFIGSHLAETLLARGHHVTVIDDLSTGCFDNVRHLSQYRRFDFVVDTISNPVALQPLLSGCDIVFHLAAAVGVQLIVENPLHCIKVNVAGTEAVLEAALRYNVPVLIASTSEVYGKGARIPFAESDDSVLGPTSSSRWSYAASKMVDEFLGLAYFRQKGLPVVVFRLFNTVGPRQTGQYGMVVPRFVQAALTGAPLRVFGDGGQSRCFLHVQDAVQAISSLASCPEAVGGVFNVGSTESVTILDLARRVLQLTGYPGEPDERIVFVPYQEAYGEDFEDMRRRVPDTSKIRYYTGWEPQHTLDETLQAVIAYMAPRIGMQPACLEKVAVAV